MKRMDRKSKTGGFVLASASVSPGPVISDSPETDASKSDATLDINQSETWPSFQDFPWRQVDWTEESLYQRCDISISWIFPKKIMKKSGGFVFASASASPGPVTSDPPEKDAAESDPTPDSNQSVAWPSFQDSPWRQVDWTEETKNALMESIRSYRPACDSVPAARVLLVGPVGAGKSSFISSVQSVFYGRVINRAMMGSSSSSSASFTKKLQSCKLYCSRERDGKSLALILSDMVGLGETNGLTLHDTLAAIKGHVPEGHKFSACCPVVSDTPGFVMAPSLAERVHCVVFVVSASDISSYSEHIKSTFHQLREQISALGVHQVALLTHVDKVCPKTATDISQIYKSSSLKQAMFKAGTLLNMPVSSIVPVKNYSEELELDTHTDTLLLKALDHILQYVDMHLRDDPDTAEDGAKDYESD